MDTTFVPHRIALRSGHRVLVRALRPDDAPGLTEAFEQLSETSRYRRFFTAKPHLSEQTLAFLTDVDHHDHEALVAVAPDSGQLVGVARSIRIPGEPDLAEVAVTVTDSWQRRGLGTALLRELAQRAAEEGIRHFTAEILAENKPMLTLRPPGSGTPRPPATAARYRPGSTSPRRRSRRAPPATTAMTCCEPRHAASSLAYPPCCGGGWISRRRPSRPCWCRSARSVTPPGRPRPRPRHWTSARPRPSPAEQRPGSI